MTRLGDPFGTFGNEELCTWRVGPGLCRFQTRRPDFARKLSQRSGAHLAAWSVRGGYLRVFQEEISPRSARMLVKRYLRKDRSLEEDADQIVTATNARFLGQNATASASELVGSITTAANHKCATIAIYARRLMKPNGSYLCQH
jgi:hypothetical protein